MTNLINKNQELTLMLLHVKRKPQVKRDELYPKVFAWLAKCPIEEEITIYKLQYTFGIGYIRAIRFINYFAKNNIIKINILGNGPLAQTTYIINKRKIKCLIK